MRPSHRRFTGVRATVLAVAALGAATLLPIGAAAQDPGDVVILVGPNGSREALAVPDPAMPPDPATLQALDTYGRQPRLVIVPSDPDRTWSAWQVQGVDIGVAGAAPVDLGSGIAEVPVERIDLSAPSVGDWLVTASLTDGADATRVTAWAWRVSVPDRTIPEAIPAPDLVLFGSSGTVVAERGSLCFLGACGDIGRLPPDRSLPALRLGLPDEPVIVTVSDGSGIARITVSATPLNVDERRSVVLLDAAPDPATTVVRVPSPGPGRWRLDVQLTLADGRGNLSGYARATVPRP